MNTTARIIRAGRDRARFIRKRALTACYQIPDYDRLSAGEQDKIYTAIYNILNGTENKTK